MHKKPKQSIQNSSSAMGGHPQIYDLELNLDQNVEPLVDFHFDELDAVLNTIPGFDDFFEFEAARKNPLAMLNTPSFTPEKVRNLMGKHVVHNKVQNVMLKYRRVSIGTYCVGKAEPIFTNSLLITRYGIAFNVPHIRSNPVSVRLVRVCIPITDIMSFKIYNGKQLSVIGLSTGSAHTSWLRTELGMEHDLEAVMTRINLQLPAPFYCPLTGNQEHKWITLMVDPFSKAVYSKLKSLFLRPNRKGFICDFEEMKSSDACTFSLSSNIFKAK